MKCRAEMYLKITRSHFESWYSEKWHQLGRRRAQASCPPTYQVARPRRLRRHSPEVSVWKHSDSSTIMQQCLYAQLPRDFFWQIQRRITTPVNSVDPTKHSACFITTTPTWAARNRTEAASRTHHHDTCARRALQQTTTRVDERSDDNATRPVIQGKHTRPNTAP